MSRALGRYELLRPLARGGMAEVYLARRRAAGVEKLLVVKRIRAERATDVKFLDLFQREAKLSMSLAHQNIVPVFDFGRIDDQVFLAMERVEGRDLGSSLAKAKGAHPIPALVAAFIASECCQALDYAHRRKSPEGTLLGIVHRDVTPRNVLLSWSGEVKLTDFGIAALAGESTAQLLGTPAYMAPEQARKEPVDARADLYAVGLVLREMLTGDRVRAETDRDVLVAVARTAELPAWPATPFDARLVAIADRATAARPDDRYDDARAMLAELDDFIVAERATNKGESPARQVAAWLDAVWGSDAERDRDDMRPSGDIVPPQHLMSFLDDGGFDMVGTGTQRSLLATAADDEAAPPPVAEVRPAPPPRRGLIGVIALAAAVPLVWVVFLRKTEEPAVIAPPADAVPQLVVDAAIFDAAVDAAVVVDAAPRVRPDASVRVRPDAAVAIDAGVTVAKRSVTINFTPWAYFTIDGDSTQYQTIKTLQLAPGRHIIHFSNPVLKITRDVTIDVPADRDLKVVEAAN